MTDKAKRRRRAFAAQNGVGQRTAANMIAAKRNAQVGAPRSLDKLCHVLRPKIRRVGDQARALVGKPVHLLGLVSRYDFASADDLITGALGLVQDESDLARELRGLRAAVAEAEAVLARELRDLRAVIGEAEEERRHRAGWQHVLMAARKVADHADRVHLLLGAADVLKVARATLGAS
jgi:hypothetical protein